MNTKTMDQLQIRMDAPTKNQAREIFESMGLDLSTAVKIYFRRVISLGNLPFDIRDINGFTPKKAQELRDASREAYNSKKVFKNS